jgi:hypothetical protein
MADPAMTLDDVKAEVRRIDPSMTEDHRYFKTAVFLVAALKAVGQSDVALHRFTGCSRGWLIRRIKNLRRAGIWKDGESSHRWYDDGFGAVEFRLDIKTAEGEMDDEVDADSAKKARSALDEMDDTRD